MNKHRILYGVQGTGNGHITRARLMADEFRRLNIDVDFVFSGRDQNGYFDMQEFSDAQYCKGLTFKCVDGRINRVKTLLHTRPLRCLRDIASIQTDRYDLVITDFEPIVSWSAKLRNIPSMALGHQYALCGKAPQPAGEHASKWLIKHFAPADQNIGFHWHRYNDDTLPPIVDNSLQRNMTGQAFSLAYLPFENLSSLVSMFQQIKNEHFVLYSPQCKIESQHRNVSIYPLTKSGFRHHLQHCQRVVCNTGFELISEALYLGLPILTKPLQGQYEQHANAMSLKELQLATVTRNISVFSLDRFVSENSKQRRIIYPNVAKTLAEFCIQQCAQGKNENELRDLKVQLSQRLWQSVQIGAHKPMEKQATFSSSIGQKSAA